MSNIWEVILQTISVSVAALLVLIVKRILEDKLSPRWQYGIWAVLAISLIVPLKSSRYVIPNLALWIETLKGSCEKTMESAFSQVYMPINAEHVMPMLKGLPVSVTDWLMVIYSVGVVIFLMWHLISYIRLKAYINRQQSVSTQPTDQVARICGQYELKPCRAVTIEGIPTAFICGIFNPLLVVPAGTEVDDKVIMHELIHLKYKDSLQNVIWCLLKSLHWCNPFMYYIFNQIGNDMESLCDQRVLELLEGEERREYGSILLDMANSKYARMPGTSSISNGGKNIARRIKAIVRFKKYPKGMAVVSVCIGVILASNIFVGGTSAYGIHYTDPWDSRELGKYMAMARMDRCSTIAGSLDTYAKGLYLENGVYLATALPLEKHEELEALMRKNENTSKPAHYVNPGEELQYISKTTGYGCRVYNLTETEEDVYSGILVMWADAGIEEDALCYNYVYIPVKVYYDYGWVVEETGERFVLRNQIAFYGFHKSIKPLGVFRGHGETGEVEIKIMTSYAVNNEIVSENAGVISWFGTSTISFDSSMKRDAEFDDASSQRLITYDAGAKTLAEWPKDNVKVQFVGVDSADEEFNFPYYGDSYTDYGIDDREYVLGWFREDVYDGWDGIADEWSLQTSSFEETSNIKIPPYYKACIRWDGEVMEEILLKEVQ